MRLSTLQTVLMLTLLTTAPACAYPSDTHTTAEDKTIRAEDLSKKAKKGQPINFEGYTITGDIDLASIADCALTFNSCTFDGNVSATAGTTFARKVSFTDCTFKQTLKIEQSVFDGTFVVADEYLVVFYHTGWLVVRLVYGAYWK